MYFLKHKNFFLSALMILLSMDSYAGDDSVLQKIAQYKQEATRYTDEKNYSKACDFWTTSPTRLKT